MPNVNDVYRVSTLGTLAAGLDAIINTWFYRISVVGAGDERSALATAFDAVGQVMAGLTGALPTAVQYQFITVQAVKPVGPLLYFNTSHTAGTVAGTYLPSQAAVIITRKTATPGRGGRGRLFMGPIPTSVQSATDNDKVTAGTFANVAVTTLNTLTQGGWTFVPVLWKRRANVSLDLTQTSINLVIKTRRSRAEGVRFHRRKKRTVGSI